MRSTYILVRELLYMSPLFVFTAMTALSAKRLGDIYYTTDVELRLRVGYILYDVVAFIVAIASATVISALLAVYSRFTGSTALKASRWILDKLTMAFAIAFLASTALTIAIAGAVLLDTEIVLYSMIAVTALGFTAGSRI